MKLFNQNALLPLGCALFMATAAEAVEQNNGVYSWQFLSGQPWPIGYYQNIGKPENLIWSRDEYPSDFFQRISNALPESELNEAFITDDDGATISLSEDAEVFITFIHEGAGYRNAFGFFTFDKNNPPQSIEDVSETIVFPNLSFPHMAKGHRLSLGNFPAGTNIGFFIAANGYWYATGVKPFKVPYYYSLSHLNPESNPDLKQHVVLLYDDEVQEVIMGFEDLPRTWGDNDFNDAIFSIKATPASAINTGQLTEMPDADDSDADGIADDQDEYPDHYRRAYNSYYPSAGEYITLAFEDNWPKLGDYDMNDLVIRARLNTIYSAEGGISGFKLSGFIDARGGANASGFALRLLNTDNDLVKRASIVIDGQTYNKSAEAYQTNTVVQLWGNSKLFTQTGESGKCSHFNTVKNCSKFAPVPFELDVEFDYDLAQLNHSDFDYFIFRTNQRSHETHFAGYPPTDLFNQGLLGQHADTSDPAQSRYFKSAENLPWALKFNAGWSYPKEYIDVLWAYPAYEAWAESSGVQNTDWYLSTERTTHIYE